MFGPPCVDSLPYLKEAIHQFPEILQSFHSFHLKDDFIPKLYFFIDRGIDQHWLLSQVCWNNRLSTYYCIKLYRNH